MDVESDIADGTDERYELLHTTRETLLPAESLLGELADNEGQGGLDLADDLLTKLDLARAYLSIGQPELAIPMLEEALEEAERGPEKTKHLLEEALREAEAEVEGNKRSA